MKKLDKLISKSFIGPAVLSYFVATFVLVMQFLWKYIDEILGKGLSILEMLELILYYALTLIPMAVPITILISSVMVFGDMAEKYELSSMKSAGISLIRIMLPGVLVAVIIALFSLFASNFLKPASLLQFNKRFITIRKQKSALSIEEGIFNTTFGETIIRVGKVDNDKRGIHDVLIYDHADSDKSLVRVYSSKHGEMFTADEGRYFVMKLDSGVFYREDNRKTTLGSNKTEYPFLRTYFDNYVKSMDMSVFNADDGLLDFNRDREQMMNSWQLYKAIDSFSVNINTNQDKIASSINLLVQNAQPPGSDKAISNVTPSTSDNANVSSSDIYRPENEKKLNKLIQNTANAQLTKDTLVQNKKIPKIVTQKTLADTVDYQHIVQSIDSIYLNEVLIRAQSSLSRSRDEVSTMSNINKDYKYQYQKYMMRLNQQYSWAMVCIVFLFIGAPLGSIIRKGGYGYPLLVAILFYMIFIVSTIYGEKLVRNDSMNGLKAAWLPVLLLLPFAVGLTYMALKDMKFNSSWLESYWYKFFPPQESKEVQKVNKVS